MQHTPRIEICKLFAQGRENYFRKFICETEFERKTKGVRLHSNKENTGPYTHEQTEKE